jgi:hypothetical protein
MLLPIMILTPEQTDQPEVFSMDLTGRLNEAQTLGKSDVGIIPFPSSIIHVGSLTLIGVLIAFCTYLSMKKRISLSTIESQH